MTNESVTSVSDWLQPFIEGVIVELPSGNKLRMKPIAMDDLLRMGQIPDMLTSLAAKTLWDVTPLDEVANDNFKVANDLSELLSIIVPCAVLEPKIYVGDGELPRGMIKLEHLSLVDKLAIFQLSIQPVDVLKRFRGQQIGNVALVQPSEVGEETT